MDRFPSSTRESLYVNPLRHHHYRYRPRREGAGVYAIAVGGRTFCCLDGGGYLRMIRSGVKNPAHRGLFHKRPRWL